MSPRPVAGRCRPAARSCPSGWQQSKVSKIETRKQLPSEDDIAAWVGAAGATPETASDLLAMLRGARVEYAAWKDTYRESGPAASRPGILELEAQTTRIAEFQPAFVPGLLQTSEYAREYPHLPCGPLSFGADEAAVDQMVAKGSGSLSARGGLGLHRAWSCAVARAASCAR